MTFEKSLKGLYRRDIEQINVSLRLLTLASGWSILVSVGGFIVWLEVQVDIQSVSWISKLP